MTHNTSSCVKELNVIRVVRTVVFS